MMHGTHNVTLGQNKYTNIVISLVQNFKGLPTTAIRITKNFDKSVQKFPTVSAPSSGVREASRLLGCITVSSGKSLSTFRRILFRRSSESNSPWSVADP